MMQCLKPIKIEYEEMHVPCGKCVSCLIARSREWATRLVHECAEHNNSIFLTLTYNDENLPHGHNVSKDDIVKFVKRLRYYLEPRKIKYFVTSEYGPTTLRPHYHAILFNISKHDEATINSAWTKGFTKIGTVTYDSCRYVADYLFLYKKVDIERLRDKKETFLVCSNGIGRDYALKNKTSFLERGYTTVRGVPVGLPRYYQHLLEISTEDKLERKKERLDELKTFYETKYKSDDEIWQAVQASRIQTEKNIVAKTQRKMKHAL